MSDHHTNKHIPVLVEQVLAVLAPQTGETYLDATAGYGGHAQKVLDATKADAGSVLVDRDTNAVSQLEAVFAGRGITIIHDDFVGAAQKLIAEGRRFDLILADIGVSSPHLDNASRGFSFMNDGPLDMRMNVSAGITAADIVNTYAEADISNILLEYGEEPRAKRIAKSIVESRPITTTSQLATVVAHALGGRKNQKIHPATKTFQALRIAVNDEISQLRTALPLWFELLQTGGRLAIISFHSLEDRIVKEYFSEIGGSRYDAKAKILTKKPVTGNKEELVSNPRARSAKLRAVVKK